MKAPTLICPKVFTWRRFFGFGAESTTFNVDADGGWLSDFERLLIGSNQTAFEVESTQTPSLKI